MARLGGELADGVYLSWCTPGSVRSTRDRMTEGAARAGRDPAGVRLAASVRVCIDDDEQAARRALATALLPYVLGWGGAPQAHNRANFERMGFGTELAELYRMQRERRGPGGDHRGVPRPDAARAGLFRSRRRRGRRRPAAGRRGRYRGGAHRWRASRAWRPSAPSWTPACPGPRPSAADPGYPPVIARGAAPLTACSGARMSRPMSSAGLEWVRAPTATKSTPVSATARAASSRSPPLASSWVRGSGGPWRRPRAGRPGPCCRAG